MSRRALERALIVSTCLCAQALFFSPAALALTPTTVTITSSANPLFRGQTIVVGATVTGSSPTGTVTFYRRIVDTRWLCEVPVGSTCTITPEIAGGWYEGMNSIEARYSGDANNEGGFGQLWLTVLVNTPTMVLSSSANPALRGEEIVFEALLTGSYVGFEPTGTVRFRRGGWWQIGCEEVPIVQLTGRARCTVAVPGNVFGGTGTFLVGALYQGDINNHGASAEMEQDIVAIRPTVSVTSSANPSPAGQTVTLTATVNGIGFPSPYAPTGTVDWAYPMGYTITGCNGSLQSGSVSCVYGPPDLEPRSISVTASYSGDINNEAAHGSLTQRWRTWPLRVLADLDGDGRSDILYRNFSTGQVFRFGMAGLSITGGAPIYTEPDTAWKIVANADFDGDGITDLLWRNFSTGSVYYQRFGSGGIPVAGSFLYSEPNNAWQIVHTPDLDGDGRSDLLWWNSDTGQVYAMTMNGASIVAQGFVYREPNTAWKIAAVGDFDGDGQTNELLWRNSESGHVYLMTVASWGGFSQTGQMIYQEPNTTWKIVAAADFDGDGKSDILWRNDVSGQVYLMLMGVLPGISGVRVLSQGLVHTEPNLAWKIVAQGDYNGDGHADLLWRNDSTGHVYMMLMDGLRISSQGMVYQEPNLAWRVLGAWEYTPGPGP